MDPKILADLIAKLSRAQSRGERVRIIGHYAALARMSTGQVRRILKAHGVQFGYAKRSDSGRNRSDVMTLAADAIATLIVKSHGDMPTWKAIEVAKSHGLIDAGLDIKPHFVDRYIRTNNIERRPSDQPAQTRLINWGDPGAILQIDSTNCAQWFFMESDGRVRCTRPGEVYHNKPSKAPPIMRYVAADPASGLFRVRYYQTDGESAEVSLAFLFWAMCRDERPELMPMAGVPKGIVLDGGSGNKSSAMKNACLELGVDLRPHLPHHAWAKGGVEKAMHVWQRAFESELRQWPAASMDELNARATASLYQFSTTHIHSRHEMTRSAFYAKHVSADGLVMPPPYEVFLESATTAKVERTVDGSGMISYEGSDYYAGELPGVVRGTKVLVAKAVLAWNETDKPVRIYAGDEVRIEKALTKDDHGNITDQRLYTKRVDAVTEAREAAHELRMAAPMPAGAPHVDVAALPTVEVPRARLRAVPQAAQPTKRRVQALMELAKRLGRELSEFEVGGLGWQDAVTLQQIEIAVAALSTLKVGLEPGRAAIG